MQGYGNCFTSLFALTLQLHFNWASSELKYMGTYIPTNLANIFALNFSTLFSSIRSFLDKCHWLYSWFGRCNIIKMSILSKFLYLFQTLPIVIPAAFFCQISAHFTKFISSQKQPRLCRRPLTLPKCYGGKAVPDALKYYQAAHLGRVVDWCRQRS